MSEQGDGSAGEDLAVAQWRGELLWPVALDDGDVIDCRELDAIGSWVHDWFRRRGQRRVVGAAPGLRRQLEAAGLPILWYQSLSEAGRGPHGVTPSERAMLWS